MRVRPHVRLAGQVGRQVHRAGVIEEDERPDHAPLPKRQDASDVEATAQIGRPGIDDQFKHASLLRPKSSS